MTNIYKEVCKNNNIYLTLICGEYSTIKDIAEITNKSWSTVYSFIQKHNLNSLYEKNKIKKWKENIIYKTIVNKKYHNILEISKMTNKSYNTIKSFIRTHNLYEEYEANKIYNVDYSKIYNIIKYGTYTSYKNIAEQLNINTTNVVYFVKLYDLKELYFKNKSSKSNNNNM